MEALRLTLCSGSSRSMLAYRVLRVSSSTVVRKMPKLEGRGLFDRELELAYLRKYVQKSGGFLLLTGPPDCGKTAILKQLAFEEAGVTWIDLRGGDFTTADKFTNKVGAELRQFSLLDNVQLTFEWSHTGKTNCIEFQQALGDYLRQRKNQTNSVPTLIMDEANVLQHWRSDESQEALLSFLNFFVKITKQDHLVNVLLATSDYYFRFWLEARIGTSRVSKQVIGDFPEAEARGFLDHMLGCPCSSEMWKDVYDTCGGRAYLLEKIATYSDAGDWPEFREELYDNAYQEVWKGLEPENLHPKEVPACWTSDAYMQILEELCKHPDGVMPWKDFVALPFCSTKIARALVCYNLLHCRARSRLARDLSWYKGSWPVVMPVSRVHLVAMGNVVGCK